MKVIRITQVMPSVGSEQQVEMLLKQLGEYVSKEPGFIEDYEFHSPGKVGRVSIWASKEAADRASMLTHTIAVRSHLHLLSMEWQEALGEVDAEHHAKMS